MKKALSVLPCIIISFCVFGFTSCSMLGTAELVDNYESIDDLIKDSPVTVIGTVDSGNDEFEYGEVTFALTKFRVETTVRGTVTDIINILQTKVREDPFIKKGDRMILFLTKYIGLATEDAYRLKGLYQGQYTIEGNEVVKNKNNKLTGDEVLANIDTLIARINEIGYESTISTSKIENINFRTVQIVFVQTEGEETTGITSIGTGFILNSNGYVITSNHLIDTGDQYVQENESVRMAAVIQSPPDVSSGPYSFVATNNFEIIAIDSEHSLALLKLDMPELISPFHGERFSSVHYYNHISGNLNVGTADFTGSVSEGTSIAVMGFPYDGFVTQTFTGEITSEEASGIYNTDIISDFNLSGSPVYSSSTGKIIGMCICDSSSKTTIIPASYIEDLLDSN